MGTLCGIKGLRGTAVVMPESAVGFSGSKPNHVPSQVAYRLQSLSRIEIEKNVAWLNCTVTSYTKDD